MGLVATSKLRKCRKELNANKEFADAAKANIESLSAMVDNDSQVPYFNKNKSDNVLYIVLCSDSGLCAGYNNNVVMYLNESLKDKHINPKVIIVGSKGVSYIKRIGLETVSQYVDIPDIPSIKEVKQIYENALSLFKNKEVAEVNVVYTDFVSPVKQVVKIETILPVQRGEGASGNQYVEPDIDRVIKESLDIYLKGKLRNLMLSAKCSEQSLRMTAMDNATSNANDLLSDLNLKYNRIRQSMITQEISEIVGGAEAQK